MLAIPSRYFLASWKGLINTDIGEKALDTGRSRNDIQPVRSFAASLITVKMATRIHLSGVESLVSHNPRIKDGDIRSHTY